jgi:hypothetical protein
MTKPTQTTYRTLTDKRIQKLEKGLYIVMDIIRRLDKTVGKHESIMEAFMAELKKDSKFDDLVGKIEGESE